MNLGYACINMTLGGQKPKITTNRSMIKKTFIDRGIDYAGELSLLNSRDLCEIVKWNVENGINFFRISSDIFPWASEYNIEDLPQYQRIKTVLSSCGNYARENGVRLTSHPGPFNVLVSPREHVVQNTITDLTNHGKVFDLLGLDMTDVEISATYISPLENIVMQEDYKKMNFRRYNFFLPFSSYIF